MTPGIRRAVQACMYEVIAVAVVTPVMALAFSRSAGSAFVLSAVMSAVAVAWNYLFNTAFEYWES